MRLGGQITAQPELWSSRPDNIQSRLVDGDASAVILGAFFGYFCPTGRALDHACP